MVVGNFFLQSATLTGYYLSISTGSSVTSTFPVLPVRCPRKSVANECMNLLQGVDDLMCVGKLFNSL